MAVRRVVTTKEAFRLFDEQARKNVDMFDYKDKDFETWKKDFRACLGEACMEYMKMVDEGYSTYESLVFVLDSMKTKKE